MLSEGIVNCVVPVCLLLDLISAFLHNRGKSKEEEKKKSVVYKGICTQLKYQNEKCSIEKMKNDMYSFVC